MVEIKTKKQLTLPQLIEWGFENDITNKEYVCNEHKAKSVIFNLAGFAEFSDEFSYNLHDTFTVRTEGEITEDTVIPKMLVKFKNPDTYGRFKNDSINGFEIEEGNIEAFYIINNDLTMTLIWRDGEIIE